MKYYEDGRSYDVVVAGGGLSGVAAAVAASRLGMDVLLVEQMQFLGGMATSGLVNPWMNFHVKYSDGTSEQMSAGIFKEIDDRLASLDALNGRAFHPHVLKMILNSLVRENNVSILCAVIASDARASSGRVEAVELTGKSWKRWVEGRVFIDATGDADLAALGGFETEYGRDEDGAVQPSTLNFRVARVDVEKFRKWRETAVEPGGLAASLLRKYHDEGRLHCARDNLLIFPTTWDDVLHFNQTRLLGVDPRDPASLTRGYSDALTYVAEYLELLRREVPGFENAHLQEIAPCIGVRESRRIVAEYMLTEDDILGAAKFDDGITRGNYSIDIHNPTGAGTVIKRVPAGDNYEIPFRSLIPCGSDNLLVAGRPVGATHVAHSALRIMPICAGIGQAAGTAAALMLEHSSTPRGLDVSLLRQTLVAAGQNLNRPPAGR
ncbi:MAG: FAD-dependent oxidoreductase [Planctomycetes bacterium]|nr:FAD-dependent oxidoreductase [Planctomycetota bacterium]